ncbi:MAG: glycosyltransferase, partial [Deltaproteobacteria bacterium]|nr:glycosyltransferase [Deltaproteobacteria bacterium]
MVSVVLPTYNRRGLVAEAVASVLSQTYRDLELIVVDDGSEDGTAEHLRDEYRDPRLTLLVQPNLGASAARNRGAAAA